MRKRGNGEGSIYLDPTTGRYRASISTADGTRKYFRGKTRAEVARKLNAALEARQKGLPPTDDRITLERHLTKWLADVVKPSVRASTYDSYEAVVRNHLVPALGKRRLTSIQPADIQTFLSDKAAQGKWSARTINYMRRVLSMALGQATAWGRVSRNVAGKGMV